MMVSRGEEQYGGHHNLGLGLSLSLGVATAAPPVETSPPPQKQQQQRALSSSHPTPPPPQCQNGFSTGFFSLSSGEQRQLSLHGYASGRSCVHAGTDPSLFERKQQQPVAARHGHEMPFLRGIDVNRAPAGEVSRRGSCSEDEEPGASSPNSTLSNLSWKRGAPARSGGVLTPRAGGGGSDDEDCGSGSRKKLRLTKDQAAVLEESFKDHNTLNPVRIIIRRLLNHPSERERKTDFSPPCIFSCSEAEGGAGEAAEPEAASGGGLVPEPQSEVNN
jgi:homeobox-leucine zipper protein